MRTYQDLTEEEKTRAREKALEELLEAITEGVRFDDKANGDNLQARIDAAGEAAEKMQTPWFWTSYIMDTCKEDLESMALADAESALYPGPEERTIRI